MPLGGTDGDTAYVAAAQEELATLRARVEASELVVRTHVRCANVVVGLLDAIDDLDPQFVIVGSHSRRGVARMVVGSISESLARRSQVPVMIVPTPREKAAALMAWSCRQCGHILVDGESAESCARCGEFPGHWNSASITEQPADVGEPTVGEGAAMDVAPPQTQDGPSMFVTAPAGAYDRSTPNAEIRIRRF